MTFRVGKKLKRFKHSKFKLNKKRLALGLASLAIVFLAANLMTSLAYNSRTYPNTKVADFKASGVSYADLTNKLNKANLLPANIDLTENAKQVSVATTSLGVSIDSPKIEANIKHKSWLPIANFFTPHYSKVLLTVNKAALVNKLKSEASQYSSSPTNAQINESNGSFVIANDSNGSTLNVSQSAEAVISGLNSHKKSITLISSPVAPTVTSAALSSNLKQLQSAQLLSLSYTYNGKTTKPSSATITSWFVASNGSYITSLSAIESYIKQVGTADNISVANTVSLATSTETDLTKLVSGSFTLTAVPPSSCSFNTLPQLIIVSVSARHLWACDGPSQVYDSAVVTGDTQLADTLTPPGTYHIYGKQTDRTLTGSDENGSWSDFVNYWMPFLDNKYGAYGFHDATWRDPSAFGNIDPASSTASNGCVELPLATAAWLYNWDSVGTTVTITN